MAAVSLFWNTNMAAVTSCENALLSKYGKAASEFQHYDSYTIFSETKRQRDLMKKGRHRDGRERKMKKKIAKRDTPQCTFLLNI